MNNLIEDDKFDLFQRKLVKKLAQAVRERLGKSDLVSGEGYDIDMLAEEIVFDLGSIIDGSDPISTAEEMDIFPYLTFQREENLIISNAGGSYMHEMTFGILEDDEL